GAGSGPPTSTCVSSCENGRPRCRRRGCRRTSASMMDQYLARLLRAHTGAHGADGFQPSKLIGSVSCQLLHLMEPPGMSWCTGLPTALVGHRLAKPRQIALSSNLGHSNPRSRARRWVLAARSWDFLSLPNFAPEVFVHARRHVFVVRMRDVFAYRLRVLEAVAANAAMPLVAGEDVRAPLGAFRVVFGIGHFQNPVKRTATTQ